MMQLGTPKRPARIGLGDLRIDQQVGVGDTADEEANETQNADPVPCLLFKCGDDPDRVGDIHTVHSVHCTFKTWNGTKRPRHHTLGVSPMADSPQKQPRIRGDKLQNRIAMTRSNDIRADLAPMPWIDSCGGYKQTD